MLPVTTFRRVTRQDVARLAGWLRDDAYGPSGAIWASITCGTSGPGRRCSPSRPVWTLSQNYRTSWGSWPACGFWPISRRDWVSATTTFSPPSRKGTPMRTCRTWKSLWSKTRTQCCERPYGKWPTGTLKRTRFELFAPKPDGNPRSGAYGST